jgi:hypothetical protein
MTQKPRIIFPRTLLLLEIERYCSFSDCGVRVSLGLTKQDAFSYCGFECTQCKRWNDDYLTRKDIPEWWDEIT